MIIGIIIKMQCIALQTPTPNTRFTLRLYSVHVACPQQVHGAHKDHTALSQHFHNVLFNMLCKHHATAIILSILGKWTVRTFGIWSFVSCGNSVRTLLCDRGLNTLQDNPVVTISVVAQCTTGGRFTNILKYTVHSTRIPHFPQNSEENFPRREFSSISKVCFPRSFLNFSS